MNYVTILMWLKFWGIFFSHMLISMSTAEILTKMIGKENSFSTIF